jgi:hypothetical protein
MARALAGVLALAVALAAPAARAAADELPAETLGLIVLRVLAYDHNLAARADGAEVTIAVVESAGEPSRACAAAMTGTFTRLARKVTVGALPVKVVRLPAAADHRALSAALTKHGAVAVYACTSAADLPAVARAARAAAALTFTTDPAALSELAVGLVRRPDKIELRVNLVAARAEAAQLSGAFLRLAKVVQR